MKFWLPKKRGQHGQDPKLIKWVLLVAVVLVAFAFFLRSAA